jgi:hypothetical protein
MTPYSLFLSIGPTSVSGSVALFLAAQDLVVLAGNPQVKATIPMGK